MYGQLYYSDKWSTALYHDITSYSTIYSRREFIPRREQFEHKIKRKPSWNVVCSHHTQAWHARRSFVASNHVNWDICSVWQQKQTIALWYFNYAEMAFRNISQYDQLSRHLATIGNNFYNLNLILCNEFESNIYTLGVYKLLYWSVKLRLDNEQTSLVKHQRCTKLYSVGKSMGPSQYKNVFIPE